MVNRIYGQFCLDKTVDQLCIRYFLIFGGEFKLSKLLFVLVLSCLTESYMVLPEETPDALREEVLADVGVYGGEGIVEQVGVGLPVHSPGQVDPRSLTT